MVKKRSACFTAIILWSILTASAQLQPINNDIFWNTTNGQPIYSQGGGIFRFPDPASGTIKYFWYGVKYKEGEIYRTNPAVTLPNATFEAVTCYSSTDLVNWTFENNVLTLDELKKHNGENKWVGRLGVAYLKELNKYVLVVQHDKEVLFTTADSPTGSFSWHRKINMKEMIGTSNTGDQTVFTDEDTGKSYLIYSYGSGRNRIYVSEIGVKEGMAGLLDCKQVFHGENREGNCLFKYKGKYYMCASNIYGWDASLAYYLVADDIRGPYEPQKSMLVMNGSSDDYAHVTQTGFFVSVKGSKQETVIYCGDRWADFAGNGLGYNQWFPLSFEGATPYFNSLSAWKLDAGTGEWKVGADNNYIKNGSFEADRRPVPNPVKPVQLELTGWTTRIIKGNAVSFDTLVSPYLNHNNTEADRKIVIGEKSLALTDKVDFSRNVSQLVKSSPFVQLEDGVYTLTAWVKNSSGFTKLDMYASGKSRKHVLHIQGENVNWKKIQLTNIKIKNGKAEIGFLAEGRAFSYCYIDDITLLKTR